METTSNHHKSVSFTQKDNKPEGYVYGASNDNNSGRTMLCRSKIDDHGAEISPLCHFSAGSRRTAAHADTHVFW